MVLPCLTYSFEHEYVAVPKGAHILTADQLTSPPCVRRCPTFWAGRRYRLRVARRCARSVEPVRHRCRRRAGQPFYSSAEADGSGVWTMVVAEDYLQTAGAVTGRPGTLTLTLDAVDRFGNTSAPASVIYATRIR
jgi:hypothetical protein